MKLRTAIIRTTLAACLLAPFFWIFREAIFTSGLFVFRDAAHYYYPLFEWTSGEWAEGRLPLWSPYENSGTPALADPTTSVFYPGKLLFVLPLGFGLCYKLYILSHVLLAAGAAWFAARAWKASPAAATACGLSYAFGGSVVFQYCNVVYLVGAAWLPLALWSADRLLRRRQWRWALLLGAVMAMMVLGGDPQTAYHAGLVAVLGLVLRRRWYARRRRRGRRSGSRSRRKRFLDVLRRSSENFAGRGAPALPSPAPQRRFWARHPALLLGGAALAAGLLAAVQILPSLHWTRRSERAAFDAPRSLYELPGWLGGEAEGELERTIPRGLASLVGSPLPGTHHEHIYQFSVAPWRWAEFIWPNFSGRPFPMHRRWIQVLPAEGRVWAPSLYLGLAPVIAALAAWRIRGGSWRRRWLCWTALLALVAALGWYGLGWLGIELRNALGGEVSANAKIGAPAGGLYWLLVNALPGYAYFRYPAKWLTVASLAISLLAARGWDAAFLGKSFKVRRLLVAVGLASVACIITCLAVRPYWQGWMTAVPPDDLFGPLNADGAAGDLLFALGHAALLSGVLLALTWRRIRGEARVLLVVAVTAVDLCVAHGWMAPTAPAEIWNRTSEAAAVFRDDAPRVRIPDLRIFRASQNRWLPRQWKQTSSDNRQGEGLLWDHDSLFPKHHLLADLSLVESRGSVAAADYAALLKVAREHGLQRPDGVREPAPEVLSLLGADYVLLPRGAPFPGGSIVAPSVGDGDLSNVALWRNSPALPRAWIVEHVVQLPELEGNSPTALARRTREVLFENGQWRDFRRTAVVEISSEEEDLLEASAEVPDSAATPDAVQCQIVSQQPQQIEIDVDLPRQGLLVLADLYDDNWRATYTSRQEVDPRQISILRTNRVQRGVWLPSGPGRVTFTYHPTEFCWGAGMSLVAWLAVLVWVVWSMARHRSSQRESSKD